MKIPRRYYPVFFPTSYLFGDVREPTGSSELIVIETGENA